LPPVRQRTRIGSWSRVARLTIHHGRLESRDRLTVPVKEGSFACTTTRAVCQARLIALLDEFCPDCGKHRVALFRYCLGCGLDFDELDARGELPGGPYSPIRAETAVAIAQALSPTVRAKPRRMSRYLPVGMAAVLAIGIAGALASGIGTDVITTAVRESAPAGPAVAAIAGATTAPTPGPVFAPTGETTQAKVVQVVDGDTIIVAIGDTDYRVRYIGMDAPESVSLQMPVEFMSHEAADANRLLVSSADVILERDVSETDQYGQLLRNVWVDRDGTLVLVGLELVREGYARISTFTPDVRYRSLLAKAQQEARVAAIGMWSEHHVSRTTTKALTPMPVETALPRLVGVEPLAVFASSPTDLEGDVGIYTWRSVGFANRNVAVHWEIRAPAIRACEVTWRVEAASGDSIGSTITVRRNERARGERVDPTPFTDGLLMITSTCPEWTLSLQGTDAS
jgi:endonuclease YncB( thermonuclease family)